MPKKLAAIGVQMHSGWGVLVAVAYAESVQILDRKRIVVVDPGMPGANQPYHYARLQLEKQNLEEAERHLALCASTSEKLATKAIEEVVAELRGRGCRVAGAVVLQGAGRALPALPHILASHPLIHTAGGEFFGNVVKNACERLKIPVENIRRRDLEEHTKITFGRAATQLQRTVANIGKSLGPPWKADHKTAALAALTILANK